MLPPRRAAAFARALAAAAAAACGDSPAAPRGELIPSGARVTDLWIVGATSERRLASDTVEEYRSGTLRARGRTTDGDTVNVPAVWTSADTTLVRAVATAAATETNTNALAAGSATMTASLGGLQTHVTVVVLPAKVRQASIRRAPAAGQSAAPVVEPDSVLVRSARAYDAECANGGGRTLAGRTVTWSSSDTTLAAVDANGAVTARAVGRVQLTAECRGTQGDTARAVAALVVRPALAARIAFTYAPDTIMVRMSDSVRAVLYDSAGAPSSVSARVQLAYPLGPPEAVVDGRVSPKSLGAAELVASGDGLEVRRRLAVVRQPLARADVYPTAATLVAGTRAALPTVARELDGVAAPGVAVSYAVDDPAVADVSASGTVTARAPGRTRVRVRADTATAVVPIEVVAGSEFGIDVRLRSTPAPLAELLTPALRDAATAWAGTVLGDLPDLHVSLPADACDDGTPADEVDVDDVVVFARTDSVDGRGGVLAYAGPCVLRADGTAAVGVVVVDSADVARAQTNGILGAVLRHELGHVLGIGTLWSRPGLGFVVRSGGAFRYVGPRGSAVGRGWLGVRADRPGVPLGEAFGAGSGHWDEAEFGAELMTPVADLGANPLSLLTIEALGDLGYRVTAAAAEPYRGYGGPLASRAPARAGTGRVPFEDRLVVPRWESTRGGRLVPLPGPPRPVPPR